MNTVAAPPATSPDPLTVAAVILLVVAILAVAGLAFYLSKRKPNAGFPDKLLEGMPWSTSKPEAHVEHNPSPATKKSPVAKKKSPARKKTAKKK